MKLAIIFALISLSLSAFAGQKPSFYGYELVTGGYSIVLVPDDEEILQKPYSYPAQYCNNNADFYCFDSKEFWFSVPKKKLNIDEVWEHNKRVYKVQFSRKNIKLLTDGESLLTINCYDSSGNLISIYLYSTNRGLLYMEFLNSEDRQWSFISTELKGFGADNYIGKPS